MGKGDGLAAMVVEMVVVVMGDLGGGAGCAAAVETGWRHPLPAN